MHNNEGMLQQENHEGHKIQEKNDLCLREDMQNI